jgi:hypothetical protein
MRVATPAPVISDSNEALLDAYLHYNSAEATTDEALA